MQVHLRISNVRLKNKGAFTLFISGTYPSGHLNHNFEMEYTGPDIIIKQGNLLFDQENQIHNIIKGLIGYGPFDLNEVKEILIGNKLTFEYEILNR